MSFLLVISVAVIGFGVSIYKINSVSYDIENIKEYGIGKLAVANDLAYNCLEKVAIVRGYTLTKQDFLLEIYDSIEKENVLLKEELLTSASTDEEKEIVKSIIELDDLYISIADGQILPAVKAGRDEKALEILSGEFAKITNRLAVSLREYKAQVKADVESDLEKAELDSDRTVRLSIIAAILSALISILIAYLSASRITKPLVKVANMADLVANGDLTITSNIKRQDEIGRLSNSFNKMTLNLKELIHNIDENSEHLASSSKQLSESAIQSSEASSQVANSITDVAKSAAEQLETSNATTRIVEEISASIEEVSASIQEISDQSQVASDKARLGSETVTKAIKQMNDIEETVNTSARVVTRLGEKSHEIGEIIDVISGIADQTNLLALNAAIEAARAGEQGRGFAVVAEEVRKLAEQSQDATKKITDIVSEIRNDTDNAVKVMKDGTEEVKLGTKVVDEAGITFNEITSMVEHISNHIGEISIAVDQVANGSEEIVTSVRRIDSLSEATAEEAENVSAVTEEQSASMEEIANSSEVLSKLSVDLRDLISKFKI